VDDSAIFRKVLSDCLSSEPDIEVVGAAPDPFVARDKILSLDPDVLTLDIEMPRMDGITFLRKLMHYRPMPVIVVSSLGAAGAQTSLAALHCGAVEVLAKPNGPYSIGDLQFSLASKVRAAYLARHRFASRNPAPAPAAGPQHTPQPPALERTHPKVDPPPAFDPAAIIAIGASTGGTQAIEAVLIRLPAGCPHIVITQHIPPVFSTAFAKRLNDRCEIEVKEAEDGDVLESGKALIAPGNFHMLARRMGSHYKVIVKDGPQVCYQRPSVDVLFHSVAEAARAKAVGVLLTGMGSDGAQGLLKMKNAGAYTIAQDEGTCVVYGMPREAAKLGAACQVLPLDAIPEAMLAAFRQPARTA